MGARALPVVVETRERSCSELALVRRYRLTIRLRRRDGILAEDAFEALQRTLKASHPTSDILIHDLLHYRRERADTYLSLPLMCPPRTFKTCTRRGLTVHGAFWSIIGVMAATILVGLLLLIGTFGVRLLLHWGELAPEAERAVRARTMFLIAYFGPELILFAMSLFVVAPHRDSFPVLMYVQIVLLIFAIVVWFLAGNDRFIPIVEREEVVLGPDGVERRARSPVTLWSVGLSSRAGLLVLVVGNLLGAVSFGCYMLYFAGRL